MKLYREAASVLENYGKKLGSVKTLVFSSSYKNIRQLYALVTESLKYRAILQAIADGCPKLSEEPLFVGQPCLVVVLLYDFLIGKGLRNSGKHMVCIASHRQELESSRRRLLLERGASSLPALLSPQARALNEHPLPRYVRVNLLKSTVKDSVSTFVSEGWTYVGPMTALNFREDVRLLPRRSFGRDPLLPDVLIFPPGTDLHSHPLVSGGFLILQDRASCFPAHILNPHVGSTVLDCCAAPGNKTSHLASLMSNTGKIFAYERDPKRVSMLRVQLQKTGVHNVEIVHQDFLSTNPQDSKFSGIQYVLVDPSCSGSGNLDRMDTETPPAQRLQSLQRFQISILKHALHFPSAHVVVYSTCSRYREENEAVVEEVAQRVGSHFFLADLSSILAEDKKSADLAGRCLRMDPIRHLSSGFFVACFRKLTTNSIRDGVGGSGFVFDGEFKIGETDKKGLCSGSQGTEQIGGELKKRNGKKRRRNGSVRNGGDMMASAVPDSMALKSASSGSGRQSLAAENPALLPDHALSSSVDLPSGVIPVNKSDSQKTIRIGGGKMKRRDYSSNVRSDVVRETSCVPTCDEPNDCHGGSKRKRS